MILLLSMLASTVRASDSIKEMPTDPRALEHYTQGNRLYRLRKFDEAIAEYQAGAMIEPAMVFDYNLGQCYRQLGKYVEAIWHYERFLKHGHPNRERQVLVTGFLSQMRAELERKAMTQPPTDIQPDPSPPATRPEPAPVLQASQTLSATGRTERWYSDGVGWGLVGTGLISGGIAGALFLNSSSLRDDANASLNENRRIELRDTAATRERIGIAIGVGGAVLIVGGLIKLAVHPSEQSRASASSWEFRASPRGLVVFGRF
jgi:tetratricopeptide (TPR) repeat protein